MVGPMSAQGVEDIKVKIARILNDAVRDGIVEGYEAGVVLVSLLTKMVAQMQDLDARAEMIVTIVQNFSSAVSFVANGDTNEGTMQ
jgi:hypothetical protein